MGNRHYLALGAGSEWREQGVAALSSEIMGAILDGMPLSIKFPKDFPVPGYSGPDVPEGKNFASFQHLPSNKRTRSDELFHRSHTGEPSDRPEGFDLYLAIFGPEEDFNKRDAQLEAFSGTELSSIYEQALSGEKSRVVAESHDTSLGRTFYLRRCSDCPYPGEPQIAGTISVSRRSLRGADLVAHASFESRTRVSSRHPCSSPEGKPYDFSEVLARLVYGFAETVADKQRAIYGN